MRRKPRVGIICLLFVVAAVLSGCFHFIKTTKVAVDQATLNKFISTKPIWTIEDANNNMRAIGGVSVSTDSIFGKLERLRVRDHPIGQKEFSRSGSKSALSYLHLNTSEVLLSDTLAISMSRITSATIHKKDPLASGAANLAIVVIPTIALVAAVCNCPYVQTV